MLAQNGDALQELESIRLLFNLTIVAGIVGAIVDRRYKCVSFVQAGQWRTLSLRVSMADCGMSV